MTEIDSLNVAFSFWDTFAYITLSAVFIGVAGEAILDFTSWVPSERHAKAGKAAVLILIAGLGGEIIAHAKNSEYTAKITGLLNRQAGEAHARASSSDERSKLLEREVELLKADNLVAAAKIIDLEKGQKDQGAQVTTVETKVVTVETRVDKVENTVGTVDARTRPRVFDFAALKNGTRGLRRSLRNVTVIRVNHPEAGPFADKLVAGLRKLHFTVDVEDVDSSRLSGVVVCRRNAGDSRIGQSLRKAEIAAKIVLADRADSPDFCSHRTARHAPFTGVFGLVGGTADAILTGSIATVRRGTVIFVGQKPTD